MNFKVTCKLSGRAQRTWVVARRSRSHHARDVAADFSREINSDKGSHGKQQRP